MNDDGIDDVLQAFENPRQAVLALKQSNKTHATGWIKARWFTSSGNKHKKTELGGKALWVHQLLLYGSAKSAEDIEALRKDLGYAWERSWKTLKRNLFNFCDKHISDPIVNCVLSYITMARQTKSKPDDSLFESSFESNLESPPPRQGLEQEERFFSRKRNLQRHLLPRKRPRKDKPRNLVVAIAL
jgi:hypothetical protein